MSEVRLIYLKTGEQIIGDTEYSEASDSFNVKNPLLVMQVAPQKLGFMEYLQMTDDTVAIFPMADVRHTFEPTQEVVNYWNQQFGVGIVVPNAGKPAQIITG